MRAGVKRCALAVFLLFALSGCANQHPVGDHRTPAGIARDRAAVEASANDPVEIAARQKREEQERVAKEKTAADDAKRERIRLEYLDAVAKVYPSYNGLRTGLSPTSKGFELFAVHDFFSHYSFSSGVEARLIYIWVSARRAELESVGITRVGVMGTRGGMAFWRIEPGESPVLDSQRPYY